MKTEKFNVNGMGCVGCSKTVQNTLQDLEGVKDAVVDFETKVANVEYDQDKVSVNELQAAVSDAGYELSL